MQVDHGNMTSANNSGQANGMEVDFDIDFDDNMGDGASHHQDDQDVLEETTNLESTFYNQGYSSGHEHGQLHGLFEGRELGREKGWELWEEMGYYEGWTGFWVHTLSQSHSQKQAEAEGGGKGRKGKEERTLSHAKQLLELISTFPRTNPSSLPSSLPSSSSTIDEPAAVNPNEITSAPASTPAPDLAALISQIRAKYRLLCAALSVRPRLAGATIQTSSSTSNRETEGIAAAGAAGNQGIVNGIEGPMKGVDTRQLKF